MRAEGTSTPTGGPNGPGVKTLAGRVDEPSVHMSQEYVPERDKAHHYTKDTCFFSDIKE